MVKFDYIRDGRIVGVRETFSAFNEPSEPISSEITGLTGITDEMVAGHKIDESAVNAFVDDAVVLVIAHNSGFDRKFSERYWPVFERKAWACSATEVDWRQHGFDGAKLGYLLNGAGYFHQARLDHYLLSGFIHGNKQLAHIIDVAAHLTVENCVCALVDLRLFLARELRLDQ